MTAKETEPKKTAQEKNVAYYMGITKAKIPKKRAMDEVLASNILKVLKAHH